MSFAAADQMSQPAVAILGSGLGGLTLGRCLRQRGVSSIVYERASTAPRHTYGITLEPWAYKPLLEVLNLDERTLRKRVAVDSLTPSGVGSVFQSSPESIKFDGTVPLRANRSKLESMLREGQDVSLEHSLSSAQLIEAEEEGQGKVELRFQNDLVVRPKLVVDALGVHSQLRKSLVPSATLEVHPFAVYSGKRYVKPAQFSSIYSSSFGNGNTVVREPTEAQGPRLEITVNQHLPNGNVSISYIYSRAAKLQVADPLHNPNRPIPGATEIPEEFYDEVEQFIREQALGQPFQESFDTEQIRSERLLHWLMRTIMVPKEELVKLVKHGVVMIGDAVHAVPILGGLGANMAISDAIQLAEVIAATGAEPKFIEDFYARNWDAWDEAVNTSKKSLAEMHHVAKPTL